MRDEIKAAIAAVLAAERQIHRAFGAPGDHGYGTPEGEALFALYRTAFELRAVAAVEEDAA